MILKLSKTKRLSFYRKTDIYIGEKDFDDIQVLIPSEVDENDASELTFKLHLVNERGEYAIRTLTVEQEGTKVVGSTSITADLTSVAQDFSVYIEMVKGNDEVIGKTNVLEIKVNPLPDEQGEIIPEDIERQRVIVSSTNPPSEAHKKYLLNALWVNYTDKTQFVLTSIDESQAPEKYVYTWERNNNHVVVSTEVAPEYTPDNVDYKYSNGDMWVQTDLDSDKILSISVCTGYTKELIDNETWRYNYTWAVSSGGVTSYEDLTDKPQIKIKVQDAESTELGLVDVDIEGIFNLPYGFKLYYDSVGGKSLGLYEILTESLNDAKNFLVGQNIYSPYKYDFNTLSNDFRRAGMWEATALSCMHVPSFITSSFVSGYSNYDFLIIHYYAHAHVAGGAPIARCVVGKDKDGDFRIFYQFIRLSNNNDGTITSQTDWVELTGGGSQIVSGVVNANGTITFMDSDGNTFTTTGSSVIGNYTLTEQDKEDIANIVVEKLSNSNS